MADCTVIDVLNGAMSLIGDPDGEISQEIWDDFQTGYGNLMSVAIKLRLPEIKRETYYTLPAYSGALFPTSLGVIDFAEPVRIWERGGVSSVAIASTTDGTPITVTTATPHGRATNDRVELGGVQGVPGFINRDWFITVLSPTTLTLNGSIAVGTAGSGGSLMFSRDRFIEVLPGNIVASADPTQTLSRFKWENGAIWFCGSTEARQLWIQYLANSSAPTSGVIGFADGRELNYLKHATAAHFSPKRQLPQGPQLRMDAYGPSGEPSGGGGLLDALVRPMFLQRQGKPQMPRLYRRRRGMFPNL